MNDTVSILIAISAVVVAVAILALVAGLVLHLRNRAATDAADAANNAAVRATDVERAIAKDRMMIELIPQITEMLRPRSDRGDGDRGTAPAPDDSAEQAAAVDALAEHLRRQVVTIPADHEPAPRSRRRVILPVCSGVNILPNTSAQITARPQCESFKPLRLVILGNPEKWVVNDIKVGNRSQFTQGGDIPGICFEGRANSMSFGMEKCHAAMEISLLVTHVGEEESGEAFHAAIVGIAEDIIAVDSEGAAPASDVIMPMSSGVSILPNTSAQITSRPQSLAFRPDRIVIGGNANDWIIDDIRVGCKSQFVQAGELRGGLFATDVDAGLRMDVVGAGIDFVMHVTYVGKSEAGEPFGCSVTGTTVRHDGAPYDAPQPLRYDAPRPLRYEILAPGPTCRPRGRN